MARYMFKIVIETEADLQEDTLEYVLQGMQAQLEDLTDGTCEDGADYRVLSSDALEVRQVAP